ncbi:MAG TPA: hypothetical protein VNV25_16555 [Gemmatimonadaceae bacterium]|nr:hypothetical protein [Gemmatimonadaceae bacterium]
MKRAIEAFEREFAPWALKLPADDVSARKSGQLRVNGWSVLYEFGADAYGDYLDYYAALRDATDARVNDDWHARIYETGQVVAFPAVLEAYLYGRDPSAEELQRARAPVLESLAQPADAEASTATIGTADTALWEDLREVVEAEVAPQIQAQAPPPVQPPVQPPPKPVAEPPRRPSDETPAEIDSVLDAAFGDFPTKAAPKRVSTEQIERPAVDRAPIENEPAVIAAPAAPAPVAAKPVAPVAPKPAAPVAPNPAPVVEEKPEPKPEPEPEPEPVLLEEESPAPRRSVPGYDPFVELRTLEPKSSRRAAPTGDDFRPYWQRYPARAAGIGVAVAAVLLIAVMLMGRGGSKPKRTMAATGADTTAVSSHGSAADSSSTQAQEDTQTVASPEDTPDTASAPVAQPTPVSTPPSSSGESTVAKPLGPGSMPRIQRTDGPATGPAASPATSDRFAKPSGS